jgi:adenine-specific DNA-methyltransferase
MSKLKLHTRDLTTMNIDRIAELFPNCVTEAKDEKGHLKRSIDFDLLRQELSHDLVEGPQERYRLDWPGKREALALANTPVSLTLRPCREESVDFENTQNIYIEGDNLDVLKLLQETYLGKVKMIYIDPPYNTGNDFIYEDDFSMGRGEYEELSGDRDEEGNAMFDAEKWKQNSSNNGRFHSEWLSMMYARLRLARNLLRDDGIIFVSIDDSESSTLKMACEEVFGSQNFIANIIILTGANQSGDGVKIQTNTEYCIAFSKSDNVTVNRIDRVEESLRSLNDAPTPLDTRPEMGYTVYYNDKTGEIIPKHDYCKEKIKLNNIELVYANDENLISRGFIPIRPGIRNKKLHRWRWGIETFLERKDEIVITKIKSGYGIYFVQKGFNAPKNVLNFSGGTNEVKSLFEDEKLFDFPKSTSYLRRLISIGASAGDIILDFFSGSATTAHAVMQLNAEDGGKRRHIMVQLPEPCDPKSEAFKAGYKTIAEIGKERIRRAGKKILAEWRAKQASEKPAHGDLLTPSSDIPVPHSPPDIGFRVLKIDSSNFADIHRTPDELDQKQLAFHTEHIKPERTPEDLLFQVLVDWGVDLALPINEEVIDGKQVFFVDGNALAACFDTGLTDELIKAISARKPMRAVFRDESYGDDSTRINVGQLFKLLSPNTELKSL